MEENKNNLSEVLTPLPKKVTKDDLDLEQKSKKSISENI